MAMNRNFADWYRAASVAPPAELLQQRWAGVESLANDTTVGNVTLLLRLFSTALAPDYVAPEHLDAVFRAHDGSFPARGNIEELRVLAGAALRHMIDLQGPAATVAALGIVCSTFAKPIAQLPTPDHIQAAEAFLVARATSTRNVGEPEVSEDDTLGDLGEKFWTILSVQREELNMLWWQQSAVERTTNRPFEDLPIAQAMLLLPAELADETQFIPGPTAILGLLVRALLVSLPKSPPPSIHEAVCATSREWRKKRFVPADDALSLCPVSLAISKSLETADDASWKSVFRQISDVDIETPTDPHICALQFYRERLFLRAISEMN